MIGESPVSIECKVEEIRKLGSHHMFIAKVLAVHAEESYLNEKNKFEFNKSRPLVYSHGEYYGIGKRLGDFGYSVRKKKRRKKQNKR